MRVLAYDPVSEPPADVPAWSAAPALATSRRAVTSSRLHLPLNEQTRHLVDDALLARVKPGAVLVNCGRGGLVDTDAAWRALTDGRLAGSAWMCSTPNRPRPTPCTATRTSSSPRT